MRQLFNVIACNSYSSTIAATLAGHDWHQSDANGCDSQKLSSWMCGHSHEPRQPWGHRSISVHSCVSLSINDAPIIVEVFCRCTWAQRHDAITNKVTIQTCEGSHPTVGGDDHAQATTVPSTMTMKRNNN